MKHPMDTSNQGHIMDYYPILTTICLIKYHVKSNNVEICYVKSQALGGGCIAVTGLCQHPIQSVSQKRSAMGRI